MNNKRILNLFWRNRDVILIFFVVFILFSIIQFSSESLMGNDSHLYIKLAELTRDHGLIKEFPWLNSTVMNSNFSGLHFLYYFLLIPFTYLGSLAFGAKLATLFFFSFMVSMFYFILKDLGLKYNLFWCLLFLSSSGYFLFRMNLARPLNFSVIFFLLVFYALIKRNNILLFIVSFLFVWGHASFPLSIFFVFVFVFVNYLYKKKIYYKTILASLSGVSLAFFVNPFFPNNLNYFNIYYFGAVPYSLTSSISEWQPLGLKLVFFDTAIIFILFLVLIVIYSVLFILRVIDNKDRKIKKIEQAVITDFLLISASVLFVAMFLQGRYIDYWIPFCVIFIAFYSEFLYNNFVRGKERSIKEKIRSLDRFSVGQIKEALVFFVIVIVAVSFSLKVGFVFGRMGEDNSNKGIQETSEWLKENTPKESIVFNVNWGDFSKLFFHNTHNYYIMGLDPKFIYLLSSEKYWLYTNIGKGVVCKKEECYDQYDDRSIYDIIKKEFNSDYVFLSTADKDFDRTDLIIILESDSRFKKVYENDSGQVWILK